VNFAFGKCVFENVYWQKKCDCSNERSATNTCYSLSAMDGILYVYNKSTYVLFTWDYFYFIISNFIFY